MRRPRKASRLPRCRDCGARVEFFRTTTGVWRTFHVEPVDGRTHTGAPACPVESGRAWAFAELVEELMGRYGCSREEAEAEVYDMPWYVRHDCRTTNTQRTGQEL